MKIFKKISLFVVVLMFGAQAMARCAKPIIPVPEIKVNDAQAFHTLKAVYSSEQKCVYERGAQARGKEIEKERQSCNQSLLYLGFSVLSCCATVSAAILNRDELEFCLPLACASIVICKDALLDAYDSFKHNDTRLRNVRWKQSDEQRARICDKDLAKKKSLKAVQEEFKPKAGSVSRIGHGTFCYYKQETTDYLNNDNQRLADDIQKIRFGKYSCRCCQPLFGMGHGAKVDLKKSGK